MLLAGLVSVLACAADNPNRNFQVTFSGCKEFVAFGPIPYSSAQASLPAGFTAALSGSDGGLVVRTSICQDVSVAGSSPKPGAVAHYGINIVSPDGTGDISNYTLLYATSSEALADQLRKTGMPVVFNPSLAVEDPAVRPGHVYISVSGENMTPYFMTGNVSDPGGTPFPFLANWWYSGKTGRVRMSTNIPGIDLVPRNSCCIRRPRALWVS
jgi:hypothetical protein